MDAQELFSRCKAGDQHALHLLYEQYRSRLLNICRQYSKGDDVAEDLLHDAFVVILTSLDQLRDADKLEPWMTSIVRNVGFHYCKHLDKEQAVFQQMANEPPIVVETTVMPDYEQLQTLVSQLPKGYQQVFRLSVFEGLSHHEISQLLGISPHSSSSQLSHAKRMLQTLIKQSWVLILLLIAIPTAIWKFLHKPQLETKSTATVPKPQKPQSESIVETPHYQPAYVSVSKRPSSSPIRYQAEAVILPDSIPYHLKEQVDTLTEVAQVPIEESQQDTLNYQQIPLPPDEKPHLAVHTSSKSSNWNIQLAYNGQIGQRDEYMAAANINTQSFASASNSYIPSDYSFNNWIDYSWALNNAIPTDKVTAETRSLMNIAAQNALINHGEMVAKHTHQLPFTTQMTLSRQLTPRLSIETGLSYTQLKSISISGSTAAYIQECQRLHYLGIPLRLGWHWYSKAHLSLYSSAGAMLELPIRGITDVNHIYNGTCTFQDRISLSVPCQWSTNVGFGIQYDITPHLGIYVESNLQYFFNDGSSLKSYRTEHPLSITLPLGIRFHW